MNEPIVVNFGAVEEFQALPAGNYPVVVESVTLKQSKDSGNPYLNWDLKISQGPSAGRHLFFISSLLPQALWRLKSIFNALGVFRSYSEDNLVITPDPASGIIIEPKLVGLPGTAVVRQEVYQGQTNNKVDDILPIGNIAPAPAIKTAAKTVPNGTPVTTSPVEGSTGGAQQLKMNLK